MINQLKIIKVNLILVIKNIKLTRFKKMGIYSISFKKEAGAQDLFKQRKDKYRKQKGYITLLPNHKPNKTLKT